MANTIGPTTKVVVNDQRPAIKVKINSDNSLQSTVPVTFKNTVYELKYLSQLSDVELVGASNGEILFYNAANSNWINTPFSIQGTDSQINVTSSGFAYSIALPNAVAIANSLVVGNSFTTNNSVTYIANGIFANIAISSLLVTANAAISNVLFTDVLSQRVGIGTFSPQADLHVVGNTGILLDSYTSLASDGPNVKLRRARGSNVAPSQVLFGDGLATFNASGYGETGFSSVGRAAVIMYAAENWTDFSQGSYITLATTDTGTTSRTNKLFVMANGNIGVGNSTPADRLSIAGTTNISGNTTVGSNALYISTTTGQVGINTGTPDANLHVVGNANVSGDMRVGLSFIVAGNTSLQNSLVVNNGITATSISVGNSSVNTTITSTSASLGNTTINGWANVATTLWVSGNTTLTGNVSVVGRLSVTNVVSVGNTTVNDDLVVSGNSYFGGASGNESLIAYKGTTSGSSLRITGGTDYVDIRAGGANNNNSLLFTARGSSGIFIFATQNGSANRQLVIRGQVSTVNYIDITGGVTGTGPTISANSSTDTNVDLNFASKAAGSINFTTGSSVGLSIVDGGIANAAFMQVVPNSTINTITRAAGNGTNIGFYWVSKGTGGHAFTTNGTTATIQFNVAHTASAVNYVQVTGAATTAPPAITVQGSDSNIRMNISSKGTESVDILTNNTGTRAAKFTYTASSVNWVQMTGGVAGAAPVYAVAGSDTNIDLALTAKGTGVTHSTTPFQVETNTVVTTKTITTTATTADQVIASHDGTVYRSAQWIIQATDTAGAKYQKTTILAIHNGTAAEYTEFGNVNLGGDCGTFNVDYSGSSIRLLVTPASVSSTKFIATCILTKV